MNPRPCGLRALALVAVLLPMVGCSASTTTSAPAGSSSTVTTSSPAGSPTATPTAATSTRAATSTAAATSGSTTPSATRSPAQSATSSTSVPTAVNPPQSPAGHCSASGRPVGALQVQGLTAAAAAKAHAIYSAATRCDRATLVRLATTDATHLGSAGTTPQEAFALPDEEMWYFMAAAALGTRGGVEGSMHIWPRVATPSSAKDASAWKEATTAGLVNADDASQMRSAGAGYLGWRLGITASGRWAYLTAGD